MFRIALITALFAISLFGQYTVKPETTMPAGVADSIKGLLKPAGQAIFEGDTKLMSFFYVSSIPPGSNSEMNVTHKDIAHGSLLGVVNFPADYRDRRGNLVKAGTYHLRLSFFPVNGAHQGIEPQRDFLILVSPSMDADATAQPAFDALMERAIKSSSVQHPLTLSCWKNDYDQENGLVKEGEDEHPAWVLYTDIADRKMAIIVVGVHTEG